MKKLLSAKPRFALVVLLGTVISLTATVTHAGFQWVPPTGKDSAPKADAAVPPAEPVPTGDVDSMVLPMPGEEPVIETVPAQPQLNTNDAAALNAAPATKQTLQLPPDYQAPLAPLPPQQNEAQKQENVLKVKTITPPSPNVAPAPPQQAAIAAPEPVQLTATPEPVMQQPLLQPLQPEPQPAPVIVETKVIMPNDAPQNAVDNTPNSQKLTINPYPAGDATSPPPAGAAPMPRPQAVPPLAVAAPVQQGDFAIVEGFGSDMPLALALQQIVPPGYAYSFGSGVNPGAIVSWDGEKPWNQIVNDMLAPHQLEAVIAGKVVNIRQQGSSQHSAAPTQEELLRRPNINDPGEKAQQQAANKLAGIESASVTPTEITPTAAPGVAVPPTAPEQAATLPLPPIEENAAQSEKVSSGPSASLQNGVWNAKAGESLKETLTRWSEKAGVEMIWMASYDYKIKSDVSVDNNFADAVQSVIASGTDANEGPDVQVTKTSAGDATGSIIVKDRT